MDDFYKMIQIEKDDKILLITDDGMVTLKYTEIYYFYNEEKRVSMCIRFQADIWRKKIWQTFTQNCTIIYFICFIAAALLI